ncbi:bifunctional DNA primase/polymerase [Nodosilinea sp. LEGE 07298]|uniref:bifunctional DNA primase/polymerase n=1 Tax=Nodosilinea sp. LEGE 07298 TaxID=2777970 RepID=UPI001880A825|nr:bifunctional DNA primase/polymerase [Nodosilinea sp. LEGE 07298]MBE9111816.1 bifunctional DNA primase/polymerase [Nodosilinea sp. LEGE 07298]
MSIKECQRRAGISSNIVPNLGETATPLRVADGIRFDPTDLVNALPDIPIDWPLTPVNDKRPLRPNWATEDPLPRGYLAHQLLNGTAIATDQGEYTQQWDGFGVRTGNSLVRIDQDGPAAKALLAAISSGDLPATPCCTSGKDERRALFYKFSETTQALIAAAGGWGGKKIIAGPGQELDFGYDGKMQVLPPSAHPETGKYWWLTSPQNVEVAQAPTWLEELVQQSITEGRTPVTSQERPSNTTPAEWPLLPPIALTGPGETNDALRQLANWGYNKLGKRTIEELGSYITDNAPKLPGWSEFASFKSRRDLAKDKNGWGYRWAKSCIKYWESPSAQHNRTAPDTQWQDWLQQDSISRMQWCIDKAKELGEKFFSQNELLRQFNLWAKEQFKRGFSKSTFLKEKASWSHLLGGTVPQPAVTVQNVPNITALYQQENQGLQGGTGLSQTAEPALELPLATATKPAQQFRKGDRVVINDGTWLPYCGKVATVQARVTDESGNTCYRLDIDYQGRQGTKARKFEALPCFLEPIPKSPTPTVSGSPQGADRGQRDNSDTIKAHWTALQAALGDNNPFVGGEWEVSPADIGKAAFKRLRDYLTHGGIANDQRDHPTPGQDPPAATLT